jgi:hypothetical protein
VIGGRPDANVRPIGVVGALASSFAVSWSLPVKAALVGREHTVIADVPYRRGR